MTDESEQLDVYTDDGRLVGDNSGQVFTPWTPPVPNMDVELRMRCVEAYCNAVSGMQYAPQAPQIRQNAEDLLAYVKSGL